MSEMIVYKDADGVHVIIPAGLPADYVAVKDVPAGLPFSIINDTDTDDPRKLYAAAREVDLSNPDGFGADYGNGSVNEVIGFLPTGEPVTLPTVEVIVDGQPVPTVDLAAPLQVEADPRGLPRKGNRISVNVAIAKEAAHERRRRARAREFLPHLDVLDRSAKGIPLKASEDAAAAQQAMTDYKIAVDDIAQVDIDSAATVAELQAIEESKGFDVL